MMTPTSDSKSVDGSSPEVPAGAREAKKARVIRVYFPPGMEPIVDVPVALVNKGDLIIWNAPLPDSPDFSIVFRNGASEDGVSPPGECPPPGYEDGGGTLDGRTLLSRIARSADVTTEQMLPRLYSYAVRRATAPLPEVHPFSIIIRQPQ